MASISNGESNIVNFGELYSLLDITGTTGVDCIDNLRANSAGSIGLNPWIAAVVRRGVGHRRGRGQEMGFRKEPNISKSIANSFVISGYVYVLENIPTVALCSYRNGRNESSTNGVV